MIAPDDPRPLDGDDDVLDSDEQALVDMLVPAIVKKIRADLIAEQAAKPCFTRETAAPPPKPARRRA